MTGPIQKTGELTVLTLSIGKQMLAIPAANLREILDPLPRTRVPGADQAAPWVLNVRGAVVPLADLRIPLGILDQLSSDEDSDTRRFVVLEVDIGSDKATVAILADAVHDVTTIPSNRIEPLPAASQFPAGFLTGLYRGEDSFVLLPDLSAIFTSLAQRSAAA
jgi:purine-binding chemotaxis protein CheW